MLANGIKLGYQLPSESSFTNMEGLKSVPELGVEPEKVEVTCLADSAKKYEFGIGDYGYLEFGFYLKGKMTADSLYAKLKEAEENKDTVKFEETYPDGTKFAFEGQISVKLGGGDVNSPIEFTVAVALQSDIVPTYTVA